MTSITNTHGWAKAGSDDSESLDDDARHAMVAVTPSNGVARRTATGGSSYTAGANVTAPW
ncbi:MAG: hypothetical protein R3F37_13440 [Candidatus Competibacteraceae bacterium]